MVEGVPQLGHETQSLLGVKFGSIVRGRAFKSIAWRVLGGLLPFVFVGGLWYAYVGGFDTGIIFGKTGLLLYSIGLLTGSWPRLAELHLIAKVRNPHWPQLVSALLCIYVSLSYGLLVLEEFGIQPALAEKWSVEGILINGIVAATISGYIVAIAEFGVRVGENFGIEDYVQPTIDHQQSTKEKLLGLVGNNE
jgi:hypothetical protein